MSKIEYDHKGNLVDVRFQKDIEAYAEWQAGNRQLNREMLEYKRMQEHYGENAPYKSLGSFRTARRSDNLSPAFKKWKYRNADKNQYERWKEIIGEEEMPKTLDDFQEIKYNKDTKETFTHLENVFQGYSTYKRDNPDSTPSNYQAVCRLKKKGIEGNIHILSRVVDLTEYAYSSEHINNQRQRRISREESESFIGRAIVSIEQGKGRRQVFYSMEGATVIDTVEKRIVTSWKRDEYDQNAETIIKEVIGNGEK